MPDDFLHQPSATDIARNRERKRNQNAIRHMHEIFHRANARLIWHTAHEDFDFQPVLEIRMPVNSVDKTTKPYNLNLYFPLEIDET